MAKEPSALADEPRKRWRVVPPGIGAGYGMVGQAVGLALAGRSREALSLVEHLDQRLAREASTLWRAGPCACGQTTWLGGRRAADGMRLSDGKNE